MNKTQRHILWTELSDSFLDTETRHNLPGIAARCLNTGVPPMEIERVFFEELTPTLVSNLYSPGAWQGFDEDFLFRVMHRPRRLSALMRWRVKPLWRSLEGIMTLLRSTTKPLQVRRDLEILARVFFDFSTDVSLFFPCSVKERQRLAQCYLENFESLFAPVLSRAERRQGRRRILTFLSV